MSLGMRATERLTQQIKSLHPECHLSASHAWSHCTTCSLLALHVSHRQGGGEEQIWLREHWCPLHAFLSSCSFGVWLNLFKCDVPEKHTQKTSDGLLLSHLRGQLMVRANYCEHQLKLIRIWLSHGRHFVNRTIEPWCHFLKGIQYYAPPKLMGSDK